MLIGIGLPATGFRPFGPSWTGRTGACATAGQRGPHPSTTSHRSTSPRLPGAPDDHAQQHPQVVRGPAVSPTPTTTSPPTDRRCGTGPGTWCPDRVAARATADAAHDHRLRPAPVPSPHRRKGRVMTRHRGLTEQAAEAAVDSACERELSRDGRAAWSMT